MNYFLASMEENPKLKGKKEVEDPTVSIERREGAFDFHAESVASEDHPQRNEDANLVMPLYRAFGVFDGVGGGNAGAVASDEANQTVQRAIRAFPENLPIDEIARRLPLALREADARLKSMVKEDPAEYRGMATTATVGIVHIERGAGQTLVTAHIGDSRMYVWRKAARHLAQVTIDDGKISHVVTDRDEAHEIQERLDSVTDLSTLSKLERSLFDRRNVVTKALGSAAPADPQVYITRLSVGDRVFAATDGIFDNLTKDEIARAVEGADTFEGAIESLLYAARERSRDTTHPRAKPDDMTITGFEAGHEPERPLSLPGDIAGAIASAEDFDDLYRIFREEGGVQGARPEPYSEDELRGIIERVRRNPTLINTVTRAHGLRNKVAALIAARMRQ
ncbi:MAG: protein phosphatase 2C domain-containing protein [Candidatus Vogelbacteria bacterium]|nr:protein phosphatase 2C domain-containing protein [Candidatus Vogelbacteria bacterium]